mgnify:CR=1 FL=1
MKYIKKAVVVEAWQYNKSFFGCPQWIEDAIKKQIIRRKPNANISTVIAGEQYDIATLEGDMHVSVGDYIIKGVNGELYPCKPDIFEKTYEKVN